MNPSSLLPRLFCFVAAVAASLAVCAQPAEVPAATNTDPRSARPPLPTPANPTLPSLFLVGDSTVRNGRDDGQGKGAEGQWGWGNPIAARFDAARINVVNRAIGGLSSRTYRTGGHWERTLALVKAGDFVLIQFGHNDNGAINDMSRARASLRGTGDESEEIDNLLTKEHEVVHTYGWYLRQYIADARARGATPIVCSPVPRKTWDGSGRISRSDYAGWAGTVAREGGVAFIDLHENIARAYDDLGRDGVMALFPRVVPDEHTHTNLAGAEFNARQVIDGLKALPGHPLVAFLNPGVAAVLPARQNRPTVEDDRPVVDASKIPEEKILDQTLPTLMLVGDSTVKSGGHNGAVGWGERIAPFFSTTAINVVNHAIGGRSSRTYYTEGRWQKVVGQLKAGDFVIIQFGHNDGGRMGDPASKNRGSVRGIGPETVEDTKRDGSKEQVHSFGWYLARYVDDAKARGATVILCSPIPHKDRWEQGRDFSEYAAWAAAVAKDGGAHFFDLTEIISDAYRKVGAEKVKTFFSDARTHTNLAGADFNAACVVAGLRGLEGSPLTPYLSEKGRAVDPALRKPGADGAAPSTP